MSHISVMSNEVMDNLDINKDDHFIDGTLGSVGHSTLVADRLTGGNGSMLCADVDDTAITLSRTILSPYILNGLDVEFFHGSFADIPDNYDWTVRKVSKILLDLGWSMDQFTDPERGFSFMHDGPLDMRLQKPSDRPTAYDLLQSLPEQDLVAILETFGEETQARKIVKAIVKERKLGTLNTTSDLVRVIEQIIHRRGKTHPATKTFQALRIAVNHEIDALMVGIPKLIDILAPGGRICIITFHSIEDRIVKQIFSTSVKSGKGYLVTKKAIKPNRLELVSNSRSRSAKLRCFERSI